MNPSYAISHNLLIKASAKEVFEAISLPEHLNNWWPLKSSGDPKLRATYNLNFTDEYDWYGEVSRCVINQSSYFHPSPFTNSHFPNSRLNKTI
jgi:uncharacterized protein YndB with AHSA1/START domain